MAKDKPQTVKAEPDLGFIIPSLNLKALARGGMIEISYVDNQPIPLEQQVAILARLRDAFLASLVAPVARGK
jgi:hypothetical protein